MVKNGPQNGINLGKYSLNIILYVRDPEKAQNRVVWCISRQNPSRGLGCSKLQEPKKPKKN